MSFFVLPAISTVWIAGLAYLLWLKTRSLVFVFGGLALYFWSIHGAWGIIYEKSVGNSELLRYHYIERTLFSIALNDSYFATLLYYALFCILVLSVALIFTTGRSYRKNAPAECLAAPNHTILLAFSVLCGVLSYLLIANVFARAVVLGQTGYAAVGMETVQFFTIHQILGRAALYVALIGFAILLCGPNAVYFAANFKWHHLAAYLTVLLVLVGYMMLLGDKNELFGGFVLAALLYIANHRAPRVGRMVVASVFLFLLVASVDYLRGFALLSGGVSKITLGDFLRVTSSIFFSNEAFAAHFSMYGAVHFGLKPSLGEGIKAFLFSVIPRNIWPDRPVGTYAFYVKGVNALPGHGYTIHHATAWYLDFGVAGIILGAILLGTIWTSLYNRFARGQFGVSLLANIFWVIAPFSFTAYFPNIIRAGIGVYKGVIIGAFIFPVLALYLACVRWRILPWQRSGRKDNDIGTGNIPGTGVEGGAVADSQC